MRDPKIAKDSETHFSLFVVSPLFEGIKDGDRHKMISHILKDEIKGGIKELDIVAQTPEQYSPKDDPVASEESRDYFGEIHHDFVPPIKNMDT